MAWRRAGSTARSPQPAPLPRQQPVPCSAPLAAQKAARGAPSPSSHLRPDMCTGAAARLAGRAPGRRGRRPARAARTARPAARGRPAAPAAAAAPAAGARPARFGGCRGEAGWSEAPVQAPMAAEAGQDGSRCLASPAADSWRASAAGGLSSTTWAAEGSGPPPIGCPTTMSIPLALPYLQRVRHRRLGRGIPHRRRSRRALVLWRAGPRVAAAALQVRQGRVGGGVALHVAGLGGRRGKGLFGFRRQRGRRRRRLGAVIEQVAPGAGLRGWRAGVRGGAGAGARAGSRPGAAGEARTLPCRGGFWRLVGLRTPGICMGCDDRVTATIGGAHGARGQARDWGGGAVTTGRGRCSRGWWGAARLPA